MRARRAAVLAVTVAALVGCGHAPPATPATQPAPPPPTPPTRAAPASQQTWWARCAAALGAAQEAFAVEIPGFQNGAVTVDDGPPRAVRLTMRVPDREHGRFYRGAPAQYVAEVVEKPRDKPGTLGAEVGGPDDAQASLGISRWTTRRTASLDVQIAEGPRVRAFAKAFLPAIDGCLCETACDAPRPEPTVRVIVVSDRRCAKCPTQIEGTLKLDFPKLAVQHLDYSEPEGKRLFQTLAVKKLPALLVSANVARARRYETIKEVLRRAGDYWQLPVGAQFDPTLEICDNGIDDDGNGKVDCEDAACAGTMPCRREVKGRLELFVMPRCEAAEWAVAATRTALQGFKGKVAFDLHVIVNEDGEGRVTELSAGKERLAESIRQLCARQHYRKHDRYLDFVHCGLKNRRADDWRACATGAISAQVIEACAAGEEGQRLLAADHQLVRRLDIGSCPTWLANEKHPVHGRDAAQLKEAICRHNPQLAACKPPKPGRARQRPPARTPGRSTYR